MFPSGRWIGHFNQTGLGRCEMQDLMIFFVGDRISGSGRDAVGAFSLSGRVLPGHRIEMLKEYDNRHHVAYLGEHVGEGIITGAWSLTHDSGTFAIRPSEGFQASSQAIQKVSF